ncbi:uncharacterized protein HD556DRAFT_1539637 [Suillus plorans]|uniref:Heterokaryon incompatibility domain-containing protein n=1 Tax=Suillus plorans TaxID=116603 RepID=A0A9P7ABZ4_9AGAM|nr:uncharacterized protein HD556DRAFT_1539637 [Suillus plorans]KAG1786303.1 hypothetical protein HD556DRAFT_1539637 [Suillus plorans]
MSKWRLIYRRLLTQDINTSPNNHTSYAHRSFVMARKYDWDRALLDAIKSIRIQPSLTGYISKGIALCGKGRVLDARAAFDVASMYTDQDSEITHFLLLIKAYLHVQLGIKALDGARYDEAADHFTAALDSRDSSSKSNIHEVYEDLVVLFGWDLKSLWQKAHHKRCDALLRAGKLQDAVKSYQHMMTSSDEITNADCLIGRFQTGMQRTLRCQWRAAFAASDYDKAIDLYSMAIDLDSASDIFFASRSEAKLSKMLGRMRSSTRERHRTQPSSHVGYQLSHSALRGAQRYDEAIEAFTIMLSKLDDAPEGRYEICVSTKLLQNKSRIQGAFVIHNEAFGSRNGTHQGGGGDALPLRFAITQVGRDGGAAAPHPNKDVRELKGLGGITKLQSFCKIARDAGYFWAWMDTCCIDKSNNAELGESVQSMFVWYRHSALTIVYLSDVLLHPNPILSEGLVVYLDDRSQPQRISAIMKELEGATGIDAQALISFRPGMRDARQKLQWASKRVTTVQEDRVLVIWYLRVHLPVIYGEKKQNALGRLLQEIVWLDRATSLPWTGSDNHEIQTAVSSLRNIVPVDSASKLYNLLENMNAPLFANCRLRLPCIAFRVTEVKRRPGLLLIPHMSQSRWASGLADHHGQDTNSFSRARPTRQTFFLVRPWDRRLLGLPDFSEQPTFADEGESVGIGPSPSLD